MTTTNMKFADLGASLEQTAKAFKVLNLSASVDDVGQLDRVEACMEALKTLPDAAGWEAIQEQLSREAATRKQAVHEAEKDRREQLLLAAEGAGVKNKRYGDYDRIGILKIEYRGSKVRFILGSERIDEIAEANGERLFAHVQMLHKQLETNRTARARFAAQLLAAFRLAKIQSSNREDGRVLIRSIHAMMVLVRTAESERFHSSPASRNLEDYPITQFLYDLAKFGDEGWAFDDPVDSRIKWRFTGQTPNMNTSFSRKSVMLPGLRGPEDIGEPIAFVRIERVQE